MNFKLQVDILGTTVQAETKDSLINLNDLFNAGNSIRSKTGGSPLQLASFLRSKLVEDYVKAASEVWGIGQDRFIKKTGVGNKTRTMVHISVAVLAAEQLSPLFHAAVHKTFIEGKIMENREYGATEFKRLNCVLDTNLPDRVGKDNKGVFNQVAVKIRERVLGADIGWDKATPEQTRTRFELEQKIVGFLELGLVRDYPHLKEIITKL